MLEDIIAEFEGDLRWFDDDDKVVEGVFSCSCLKLLINDGGDVVIDEVLKVVLLFGW